MNDPVTRPRLPMPIKATPYQHQTQAFNFACGLFGLARGGDASISISSAGCALLMEMLAGHGEKSHIHCDHRGTVAGRPHQSGAGGGSAVHPRGLVGGV